MWGLLRRALVPAPPPAAASPASATPPARRSCACAYASSRARARAPANRAVRLVCPSASPSAKEWRDEGVRWWPQWRAPAPKRTGAGTHGRTQGRTLGELRPRAPLQLTRHLAAPPARSWPVLPCLVILRAIRHPLRGQPRAAAHVPRVALLRIIGCTVARSRLRRLLLRLLHTASRGGSKLLGGVQQVGEQSARHLRNVAAGAAGVSGGARGDCGGAPGVQVEQTAVGVNGPHIMHKRGQLRDGA